MSKYSKRTTTRIDLISDREISMHEVSNARWAFRAMHPSEPNLLIITPAIYRDLLRSLDNVQRVEFKTYQGLEIRMDATLPDPGWCVSQELVFVQEVEDY